MRSIRIWSCWWACQIIPPHYHINLDLRSMLSHGCFVPNSRQTSEHKCGTSSHCPQTTSLGLLNNFNQRSGILEQYGYAMGHISMTSYRAWFVSLPASVLFVLMLFTGWSSSLCSSNHCFYYQVVLLQQVAQDINPWSRYIQRISPETTCCLGWYCGTCL